MGDDLTANERAALDELVFELSGPHTLADIARRLGLSAQYVHELERDALWKLQRAARRAGLDDFFKTPHDTRPATGRIDFR